MLLAAVQGTAFLKSILLGAVIALIYDIFRIKRKTVKTKAIFIHIEDILYWLIVSIVILPAIYYINNGELRIYIFMGIVIGAVIYELLFGKTVVKVSVFIIILIKKFFLFIFNLFKIPVKYIYAVLKKVLLPACSLLKRFIAGRKKKIKKLLSGIKIKNNNKNGKR